MLLAAGAVLAAIQFLPPTIDLSYFYIIIIKNPIKQNLNSTSVCDVQILELSACCLGLEQWKSGRPSRLGGSILPFQ